MPVGKAHHTALEVGTPLCCSMCYSGMNESTLSTLNNYNLRVGDITYMYPRLLASPNPLPIKPIPGGLQLYAEISAPKIVQETFPVILKQKNPLKIHYYNE